ncbi:hypothetical protein F4775DRAFT_203220 [Biscogniauxia sp. FL1348]|nr:hypothetical protein F4775DRAFT_203220 [Biscogniauxia sp. FL1348]
MASITSNAKASKPSLLTVSTKQVLPTPSTTTSPSREKSPDVSLEFRRPSSVSTPASAHANGFDTDIEAMMPVKSSDNLNKTSTCGNRSKSDASVWPGQDHWKQKARNAKINNRSCQCMARLSKRTRVAVKIALALFIIGVAVSVGFGISKSLGAKVWQPDNN